MSHNIRVTCNRPLVNTPLKIIKKKKHSQAKEVKEGKEFSIYNNCFHMFDELDRGQYQRYEVTVLHSLSFTHGILSVTSIFKVLIVSWCSFKTLSQSPQLSVILPLLSAQKLWIKNGKIIISSHMLYLSANECNHFDTEFYLC